MRAYLFIPMCILFFALNAIGAGLGGENAAMAAQPARSGWQEWLLDEAKIYSLAEKSTKIASDSGLDGLTNLIARGINDIDQGNIPPDKTNILLAMIWVASINGQMLQDMDPFKNEDYQKIISVGMDFSADRLRIPDIEACMRLTIHAIIKAQKAELAP